MQKAHEIVATKGGVVVSEGSSPTARMRVRCAEGHEWEAKKDNIVSGHWCPHCYGNAPLTLAEMQAIAESRGGRCLSDEYANIMSPLRWACAYDHEWVATPNNVKHHGSWCPHCVFNVGEELVRAALEEAFPGKTFGRTRREPWMGGLELDGFNEELRLAFEYQGRQHYERVPHFHRREGDFQSQQERDRETAARCEGAFMSLIVVPYTVGFAGIRSYVRKELLDLAYDIAPAADSDAEFYDRVRAASPASTKQFERAVEVITKKGGVCLSDQYVGYRVPLRIRCGAGHIFEASLEAIDQPASRGPRFCPECGGTRKKEDDYLREAVESCGYAFLGVESRETKDRKRRSIRVRCPQGHEYDVLWDNFKPTDGVPRKGCSRCSRSRVGAAKRGDISGWCDANGVVAVTEYCGLAKPCAWKCTRGHEFTATLASIRIRKQACIECWIADVSSANRLQCLTLWTPECNATTQLNWICHACGVTFSSSVINFGRKLKYCPNCP